MRNISTREKLRRKKHTSIDTEKAIEQDFTEDVMRLENLIEDKATPAPSFVGNR